MSKFYKSVTLFLPLAAVFAIGLALAPIAQGQNLHDDPWRALPLYAENFEWTFGPGNVGAQPDAGPFGEPASCVGAGDGLNSVYAVFRPLIGSNYEVTLDTSGSDFDTIMTLMTQDGTEIACNDDGGEGTRSRLENIPVVGGEEYLVRITGFNGAEGALTLSLNSTGPLFHPYNTVGQANAILSEGDYFDWNFNAPASDAGSEYPASCTSDSERSVWYIFNLTGPNTLNLEITNTGFDTVLSVFDANLNEIACDDDGGEGTASALSIDLPAGVGYVRVSSYAFADPLEGSFFLSVSVGAATANEEASVPEVVSLDAAYPNPFASRTTLPYFLPDAQQVRVVAYDILGREVAVLYDGVQSAGEHEAVFEAMSLPSGIYVVRLTAGKTMLTRRVTVVR